MTDEAEQQPAETTTSNRWRDSSTSRFRLAFESALGSGLGAMASGGAAFCLYVVVDSWLLALIGVVAISAGIAYWTFVRSFRSFAMVGAIHRAVEELSSGKRIVRLESDGVGSTFGHLAESFNRIFDVLSQVSRRVLGIVQNVRDLPQQITAVMVEIQESADDQEEAVEETASLLANINSSMGDVNERIERLQRAAEESASSILQMGSAVDEVARNAATLHEGVEASTSSVHEMGASIRQVAESAGQVEHIARSTAHSMLEMDSAVQSVTLAAQEASQLTLKVSEGAESGSQAVRETIDDIQQIYERTTDARQTLTQLAQRISEIGSILNVIGEINDETNLLSLNAAIIAAQAGEQGKAFLVVANHVKTLARRTASSTTDIAKLISDVQTDSERAVTAMSAGVEAIETGVRRSRAAGEALDAILVSSRDAYDRVEGIARSTDEQSRSSRSVADAAQETSNQVRQISEAMAEQTKVSEQMLANAEAALDACRHVHRSTDEQRETGRYISESISSITEMIGAIRESASNHARASKAVSEAVERLLRNAQRSGAHIPEINAMLELLRTGAAEIVGELSRFESVGGDIWDQPDALSDLSLSS